MLSLNAVIDIDNDREIIFGDEPDYRRYRVDGHPAYPS